MKRPNLMFIICIIYLWFIMFLIVQTVIVVREHKMIEKERDAFFEKYHIEKVLDE